MADENQMRSWLAANDAGKHKNVIIYKNGTSAELGQWEREVNHTVGSHRYNIYIGATGTWANTGSDLGPTTWLFTGNYERSSTNKVVFKPNGLELRMGGAGDDPYKLCVRTFGEGKGEEYRNLYLPDGRRLTEELSRQMPEYQVLYHRT